MHWRILLGLLSVLLMHCASPTVADHWSPPATTEPRPCADSVARVQAYKAPGQKSELGAVVNARLAAESLRRPVGDGIWSTSPQTRTDQTRCIVHYETTIGNAPAYYSWMLTLATGRVEASDDATKRISGW